MRQKIETTERMMLELDSKLAHSLADKALMKAKEIESKNSYVFVRVDERTVKMIEINKAKRLGLI